MEQEDPQITGVSQVDNKAAINFKGESQPALYPAFLLHAAKDLAAIMIEKDEEKKPEKEQT